MAAVSPAFRPTTSRITTPIAIAALVASRKAQLPAFDPAWNGASGVQHAQRGEHLEQNRADLDLGSTASKKVRALVVPERVAVGLGRVARIWSRLADLNSK